MRSHKASLPQADGNCYFSGLSFHMTGFTKYIELKWADCKYAKIRAGLKAQENWHLLRCVRVDSTYEHVLSEEGRVKLYTRANN